VRGPRSLSIEPHLDVKGEEHAVQETKTSGPAENAHSGLDRNPPYRSCGQECYSELDIADAFSDAVGLPVEASAVPRAKWGTLWGSQGMSEGRSAPRAEMVNAFNSGWIHFGPPGIEHVDGSIPLHAVITQFVTRSQLYKVDLEAPPSMGRRDWPQSSARDTCFGRDHRHPEEPRAIRCDNGPELTTRHFLAWCIEKKIEAVHIQPSKPTQNALVESFHGSCTKSA
jgi:hypothetical protein